MIPKIIHYCWLSNDPIPTQLQNYISSWKKHLPDYEFMLWNFERFDKESSIWVKQAFEAKKYAFAADYIRLYALYNHGGIYLDMDVEVLRSFNSLLSGKYIIGYETQTGIEGGIIGAEPNSNWVKKCLEHYENKSFINEKGEYETETLPKIIYKILKNNNLLGREIQPLPNDYLTAKSYKTGVITITSNTYSIHHFAGSWHGNKEKLYKFISKVLGIKIAKACSRIYKLIK